MTVKIKVKDKLEDNTLDLSFCDLQEVPIREITTIRKASSLDLSNNQLVSIPNAIVTLTNIVKLDLSKNMLTEIPQNIGEMRQLRHLDLYSNQISRLPLSLGELKNLEWLDLKDNPLTAAVASVAGLCSNSNECQACARNIIAYLANVKQNIEEERLRRMNTASAIGSSIDCITKKEMKKKKKKRNFDKEEINIKEISSKFIPKYTYCLDSEKKFHQEQPKLLNNGTFGKILCNIFSRILYSIIIILILIGIALPLIILLLSKFNQTFSNNVIIYLGSQTKLPIEYYQQLGMEKVDLIVNNTLIVFGNFKSLVIQHYENITNNF
ncbi:hypothetical protein PV325_003478 [Microctonus aethiopoides]|uniref:Leucine-rich repeat protein n=1 Tax=Microctonus aethiopoides TaxID=144406 RepID=A0AA39FW95_9HYME|nr:hypothetical protein PV325_003478 [Microctonus aethiopoides]KAK0177030.1 hypothetical protein PV328_001120 [Microctonus aethiopoides]